MKKNYIFGIAAALMMGTVALSSCSSDELTVGNEAQIAKEVAKTYSFSVPASMDDEAGTRVFTLGEDEISSAFSTAEPVYVIIEKENGSNIAYGCDKDDNTKMALYPTDVSADGASCTIITDNLTFIPKAPGFEVEVGDKVYLYYGMTVDTNSNPLEGYFDFTTDGSKDTAQKMDYNKAEMVITGVDAETGELTFGQIDNPEKTNFSFKNINSIFRQRLSVPTVAGYLPTLQYAVITMDNGRTVQYYYPFGTKTEEYAPVLLTSYEFSFNFYFSLIFNDDNKNETITFTAVDSYGRTLTCTKSAPDGGFKNNMYYYGSARLQERDGQDTPIIIGAKFEPDDSNIFTIDVPFDFGIIGNTEGYAFNLQSEEGTIKLIQTNATYDGENGFLYDQGETKLKLILTGDNTISRPYDSTCIMVHDLKLSCTGKSATITLRAPVDPSFSTDNYNYSSNDYSVLAADGFTVTRSEPTTDGNLCSVTYTVTKNP